MISRLNYSGTTPGADSNTYNLWTSTTAGGGAYLALSGARYFVLDLKNAAAGTLKVYKSADRGTNWSQIEQVAVSAAPTAESNRYEFLTAPFQDWKIDWVNGGSTQASAWGVDMCLSDITATPAQLPEPATFQSLGAATTGTAKASRGNLLSITATNRNAAVRYLQLFNSTSSTATVLYQWPVAATAGTITIGSEFFTEQGWPMSAGITWGMSTTAGSYVAATASETDVAGSYR